MNDISFDSANNLCSLTADSPQKFMRVMSNRQKKQIYIKSKFERTRVKNSQHSFQRAEHKFKQHPPQVQYECRAG